jgi:superfamily II DNA or RNA helicase
VNYDPQYFGRHYSSLRLPKQTKTQIGLRRGQIGASHALAAHFTVKRDSAIVVLPTGSGKTAVLMMCPFLEEANRVLVVTPSRLLRDQIAEEFASLIVLRRIQAISEAVPSPLVHQVRHRLDDQQDWEELRDFNVVVTTPNTISPVLQGIARAPEDMFDLLLIDEAHHSPAITWKAVLEAFPKAKRALFTATPFRRDRKHIKGTLVFNYSLSDAKKDGVFGEISFVPVKTELVRDSDLAIAAAAEAALAEDRAKGLKHSVLVRTDSKQRGEELLKKYESGTKMKVALIHSGHSARRVRNVIERLKKQELDAVICVNMLGEGFDCPNLKIAALHAPHRSLGVTLQFIGRFARTGDTTIGPARFFAVPSEIEGETSRLFKEDANWENLVVNLAEARVASEDKNRMKIGTFSEPAVAEEELDDLSLYALRPAEHVKVYQVPDNLEVDLDKDIELPRPFEVVFRQYSEELTAAVVIANEQQKPPWSDQVRLGRSEFELFVIFFDPVGRLLFINASRRSDSLYRAIATGFLGMVPKILPLYKINRCLGGLSDIECFSVGMKNRLHNSNTESYRIVAGRNAHQAIKRTDGRLFHRGHIFSRALADGAPVTIGYSSSSKIWSANKGGVGSLIGWCENLATKMRNAAAQISAPGIDILSVGEPLFDIPANVFAVDWDEIVYFEPVEMVVVPLEGEEETGFSALDMSLRIDRGESTSERIRVIVERDDFQWRLDFSVNRDSFFQLADADSRALMVRYGGDELGFADFLNEYPLHFYFADLSRLRGEEWFPCKVQIEPFDRNLIQVIPWKDDKVAIDKEYWKPNDQQDAGSQSIHEFVENMLARQENSIVFYDHRSGEVADFVVLQESGSKVTLCLYHCKASGGPNPGDRVGDAYEVCGQVVKSFNLIDNEKDLIRHVRRRAKSGSRFVKGDVDAFENIVRNRGPRPLEYQFVVVQPGISKKGLGEDSAAILAAAHEYVRNIGARDLVVLASE